MIPFNIEKLSVVHVKMKTITTALGGSMSVVDERKTESTGKETLTKIKIPMAVARIHIKKYKTSRYLNPVLVAATMYDGHVVAIERCDDEAVNKDPELMWTSQSERHTHDLDALTRYEEWYTDGVFVYKFNSDQPTILSSDGKFQAVPVDAIKLASLPTDVHTETRSCLRFTTASNISAISPPIWKNLSNIGSRQLERVEEDGGEESVMDTETEDQTVYQFDRIDQFLSVNLSFALKAAAQINDTFGYDAIEPLALDDLMVQLRTVNLLKMPKEIKRTFDTGMKFTHAVTWLLGMMHNLESLKTYKTVRSLLKYLTTKGVYRSTALKADAIYHEGQSLDCVPLITIEEALEYAQTETGLSYVSIGATTDVKTIGSLYGAE